MLATEKGKTARERFHKCETNCLMFYLLLCHSCCCLLLSVFLSPSVHPEEYLFLSTKVNSEGA